MEFVQGVNASCNDFYLFLSYESFCLSTWYNLMIENWNENAAIDHDKIIAISWFLLIWTNHENGALVLWEETYYDLQHKIYQTISMRMKVLVVWSFAPRQFAASIAWSLSVYCDFIFEKLMQTSQRCHSFYVLNIQICIELYVHSTNLSYNSTLYINL